MITSAQFQNSVSRLGEILRREGIPDDKVQAIVEHWLQELSLSELADVVKALEPVAVLLERPPEGEVRGREVLDEAMRLRDRIKEIAERPELAALAAAEPPPAAPAEPPRTAAAEPHRAASAGNRARFPAIKVDLADLGKKAGPITRRVSYAMRDAGVDEAEIDRYKDEVKTSADPVGVTRRWVRVG